MVLECIPACSIEGVALGREIPRIETRKVLCSTVYLRSCVSVLLCPLLGRSKRVPCRVPVSYQEQQRLGRQSGEEQAEQRRLSWWWEETRDDGEQARAEERTSAGDKHLKRIRGKEFT